VWVVTLPSLSGVELSSPFPRRDPRSHYPTPSGPTCCAITLMSSHISAGRARSGCAADDEPLAIEGAAELTSRIVQRARVGGAVVPNGARRPGERLRCANCEGATNRVLLVANDCAHCPASHNNRAGADVLEGDRFGEVVYCGASNGVVRCCARIRIGVTIIERSWRQRRCGWAKRSCWGAG
jgi:hypothetical protein